MLFMSDLKKLIQVSRDFAIAQVEEFSVPSSWHLNLSFQKGQFLAERLGADKNIVAVGTYLMDCMLGIAIQQGRIQDHVSMSKDKAQEILAEFSLTKEETTNILACVSEHHGTDNFYSLESEICCNADCYRFASVAGFIGGIYHSRKMPLNDLLVLYAKKADEKWQALSIDSCRKELKSEYDAIKNLINNYQRE